MSVNCEHELEIANHILANLDCPRALTVAILLRYGHYDDIVSLRAVPEHYLTPRSFADAYQATRLLQKSEWLPTSFDKKKVALESFWIAEAKCAQTNEFFEALSDGRASFARPGELGNVSRARRKIREMLRGFSPFAFLDHCDFGPGADMTTKSGLTSAYNKLSSPGSVTRECSIFLDFLAQNSALGRKFQWDIKTQDLIVERVRGNRVAFVPKDCKTDRSIAVEPRWNVFFQLGMGRLLKKVLKRAGQDLSSQSRNQTLARSGSLTGQLSTLDLQSASDSVSAEFVRYMLPQPWVHVLDRLRSKEFRLSKEEWYRANKWSSMGNGYTFELESMLFYALAWSVCGDRVSVYGDDIIVPVEYYSEVVQLLNTCGFTVNERKSFHTGPFRESCGGDYFQGVLVTPIYWKARLNVEGTLRLANQITRLARNSADGFHRDSRYRRVWQRLVSRLPSEWARRGPTSVGSCVHDSCGAWAKGSRWGWDGWFIRVLKATPQRFAYRDYDAAMLSQHFSPSSDGYVVRDRVRYQLGTLFIPCGGDEIGPWV